MADIDERNAKLVQYLSEAHGKERELETSLQAHIAMTSKAPYKKRLKEHLKETKRHARELERRIKKLGGASLITQTAQTAVGKAMAVAKGPLHAIRGGGEHEKMLKNAKTEYFNEHEEIATYLAIEVLAERIGDKETARLAKGIRREEERMAKFLEGQIKALTRAVVSEELPRARPKAKSRTRAKTKPRSRSKSKAKPRFRAKAKAKPRSRAKPKPRSRATSRKS